MLKNYNRLSSSIKTRKMKTLFFILALVMISFTSYTQTNSNSRYQRGYVKKSTGTYVQPHYKTTTNKTNHDNYSTKTNTNN